MKETSMEKSQLICSAKQLIGFYRIGTSVMKELDSSQQTFQRRFNVAFGLIWRLDVAQRQINVETTLRTSTLKSTTFNNVVYFNVELNNVRQRRNNVVIFNVDFHNVGQRRNNVANMTISKKKNK